MKQIRGVLFEPVGCLAEFPAEPFLEAVRLFTGKKQAAKSGSRAYWHVLNLMEAAEVPWDALALAALEVAAVNTASVYEDVLPALAELKAMGTQLGLASSLSAAAVLHFLEISGTRPYFSGVFSRDEANGIKVEPLATALAIMQLEPAHTVYLTDTAEGLNVAGSLGLNSILMMNDPDDAKRLAMKNPSGGIVSLHELPDFLRFVQAQSV